jgi:NAD(P)-dependent dehydrogenase (short-subunit alcohol dehydrogenase family)
MALPATFLCKAEELSPNGFGTVVDIDLKGTFNVCRASFEELKKNQGQILNISATLHYLGTPMQIHVSAAKAGVDALTRNLAVEWGRYGIRVNAIAPGPIGDTEGMKRLVPEPIKEKLKQRIPLGRFGMIADIEKRGGVSVLRRGELHKWRSSWWLMVGTGWRLTAFSENRSIQILYFLLTSRTSARKSLQTLQILESLLDG